MYAGPVLYLSKNVVQRAVIGVSVVSQSRKKKSFRIVMIGSKQIVIGVHCCRDLPLDYYHIHCKSMVIIRALGTHRWSRLISLL